ncbi:hypothetical protein YB2330_001422 [Saitoella coloradoensis]
MSYKRELEIWVEGCVAYDKQDYDGAIAKFEQISESSRILFNIGIIHATRGEHEKAVVAFQKAVSYDMYFAVAYFQAGVSNFLRMEYRQACEDFNAALLYLRGNNIIDYDQLGLKFKLYSCEVLFNRGLSYIYSGDEAEGMQDLMNAVKEKQTQEHDVIDEAIAEKAKGFTVFSIPVGVVYRPNEKKVKNAGTKDYIGKAKLVATTDAKDAYTGFSGAEMMRTPEKDNDDRVSEGGSGPGSGGRSFAASNLVKPPGRSFSMLSKSSQKESVPERSASVRGRGGGFPTRPIQPPTPPMSDYNGSPQPARDRGRHSSDLDSELSSALSALSSDLRTPPSKPPKSKPPRPPRGDEGVDGVPPLRSQMRTVSSRDTSRAVSRPKSGSESVTPSRSRATSESRRERDRSRRAPSPGPLDDVYNDYFDGRQRVRPSTASPSASSRTMATVRDRERMRSTSRSQRPPPSRKNTYERVSFEDDDEEYFEGPDAYMDEDQLFEPVTSRRAEIVIRKVKLRVRLDDVRVITIRPDVSFRELENSVRKKFELARAPKMKFRDEDGELIRLGDEDDLEEALTQAKKEAMKDQNVDATAKLDIYLDKD